MFNSQVYVPILEAWFKCQGGWDGFMGGSGLESQCGQKKKTQVCVSHLLVYKTDKDCSHNSKLALTSMIVKYLTLFLRNYLDLDRVILLLKQVVCI